MTTSTLTRWTRKKPLLRRGNKPASTDQNSGTSSRSVTRIVGATKEARKDNIEQLQEIRKRHPQRINTSLRTSRFRQQRVRSD